MSDLLEIFESQNLESGNFDIKFDVQGKQIFAHKDVLKSASNELRQMVSGVKIEKWSIKIEKHSFEDFYEFLKFLYSGNLSLSNENISAMSDLAEDYQIEELRQKCDEYHFLYEIKKTERELQRINSVKKSFCDDKDDDISLAIKYFSSKQQEGIYYVSPERTPPPLPMGAVQKSQNKFSGETSSTAGTYADRLREEYSDSGFSGSLNQKRREHGNKLKSKISSNPSTKTMADGNDKIEIKNSCGRDAQIGDIYDARTEQLVAGSNIFNTEVHDFIHCSRWDSTSNIMLFETSVSDKANAIGIHYDLLLSILAGLVKTDYGAEKCLDEMCSAEEAQCIYVEKIRTINEKINIFSDKLKNLICDGFHKYGTHVVVGITYGVNATVTMTYENTERDDTRKHEVLIKTIFERLQVSDLNEEENKLLENIRFKVHSDVVPPGMKHPSNVSDTLLWIHSLEKHAGETHFKGKQMEYHLMPLQVLQKKLNLPAARIQKCKAVHYEKELLAFLISMKTAFEAMKVLLNFINENSENVSDYEKHEIKKRYNESEYTYTELRQKFASLLIKHRFHGSLTENILQFINRYDYFHAKVQSFIESYTYLKEKMKIIKKFRAAGVSIITDANEIDHFKIDNYEKEIYFFFFGYKNGHQHPHWSKYVDYFNDLTKNCNDHLFAIVDMDVISNHAENNGIRSGIQIVKCFEGKKDECKVT